MRPLGAPGGLGWGRSCADWGLLWNGECRDPTLRAGSVVPRIGAEGSEVSRQGEELVVRQHARQLCDLGGLLRVSPESAVQLVLGRGVTESSGALAVRVVDGSPGGAGVWSKVFVPRSVRVSIVVGSDSGEGLEFACLVKRASMIDRTPLYYLGLSFVEQGEQQAAKAARLLALMASQTRNQLRGPGKITGGGAVA